MKTTTRKFNWISSLEEKHLTDLHELQEKMMNFYSNHNSYYSEIDFTSSYWDDDTQLLYKDIQNDIGGFEKILEIGCGSANCLRNKKIEQDKYTGIDFSENLIGVNKLRYPTARFYKITDPYYFPFENETFDLVFSIFVIEHTVFPHKFLSESIRILKKNGRLIILCPNFLGCSRLTSQRVGFGPGSGREKLKKGKIFDALVTGYDNKIRLQLKMALLRVMSGKVPKFYVNLTPTCFSDPFYPDVDAIYLTYETEIKNFFGKKIKWLELNPDQIKFAEQSNLIYMKGDKVES